MPKYITSVRIDERLDPEDQDRVPIIGPEFFEVEADSERQAEEQARVLARRGGLRIRRDRDQLLVINVWEAATPERHYFGFQSKVESPQLARSKTGVYYLPGQLYGFYDRDSREAWVTAGGGPDDVRRAYKANELPPGWRARDALDPDTEEPLGW